jgi:integrase/recombinase XerD
MHLLQYRVMDGEYLFPGRDGNGHITYSAVQKYWQSILTSLGFTGFSTHSSRRWVINQLRRNGVDLMTIGEVMSMNINTVRRYTDNDPVSCDRAIATLSI